MNIDQTSSKFVAIDNITMPAQGEKHVSRHETTGKSHNLDTIMV